MFADVSIETFSYSFINNLNGYITVNITFNCYIYEIYEGADHFAFNIVAYDAHDIRIKTEPVFGIGYAEETVRVHGSLTLSIEDVKQGIRIDFQDYTT